MSQLKTLSAASCRRSAQLFNLLAVASTLLAIALFSLGQVLPNKKLAFLPMAMSLPPIMIWLAASIFVYASIAHHPDPRVRHYNKWAGYRYYGLVGFMTIFANDMAQLPGGWWLVWGLFFAVLVPWALWDVWRAAREPWQDVTVEVAA
ncbi:MAG: hypothetical protein NZ524_06985 [Thiobacillaceae bacterium]|nr:hypothetical protein [Thiobacillaceae bacterium]MCX7672959.1 hypothetical protein [Thiobacillaceae bacterium]MDW8324347.1 hypothetical protein [Burkholderiales bacterium]